MAASGKFSNNDEKEIKILDIHVSDKGTLTILMTRQKKVEWSTQLHLLIIQSVHRRLESAAYDCWSWDNNNAVEAFVEYIGHNNGSDIKGCDFERTNYPLQPFDVWWL